MIDSISKDISLISGAYCLITYCLSLLISNSLFDGKRNAKMKAADAAWFGASWWPYADYQRLRIATFLSMWVS